MRQEYEPATAQSKDLMTSQQSDILKLTNYLVLSNVLCIFGVTSNIINTIIFIKQGFEYTMNISLCALSISDLGGLLSQIWVNMCFNPLLTRADIPFVPEEVQYLTGTGPTVLFGRINGWITVFITAERCLGIAVPLKVKQLVTPGRTGTIMFAIYIGNILAVSTEYFGYYLDWVFYPARNKTLYRIVLNKPNDGSGIVSYILNVFIGYGSFIAVIIFTAILAVNLSKKAAWRKQATSEAGNKSSRDRRTVKMVVLIATILTVCSIPFTIVVVAIVFEPEFSILGKYQATFLALLSIGFLFQNINSSVNIFLYYKMSTKYRQTFHELFGTCIAHSSTEERLKQKQ